MTDKIRSGKDAEIRKAYRLDRKDRPAHRIGTDEQEQIERLRRSVVQAVTAGEGQKALDILKKMGCGPDSPEYKAVIALLYPAARKK